MRTIRRVLMLWSPSASTAQPPTTGLRSALPDRLFCGDGGLAEMTAAHGDGFVVGGGGDGGGRGLGGLGAGGIGGLGLGGGGRGDGGGGESGGGGGGGGIGCTSQIDGILTEHGSSLQPHASA